MPQHVGEGALLNDRLIDVSVLELEVRGGPRRSVPNETAPQNQRVERVHAHENARDWRAGLVQPAGETVDQLFQRQVAKAGSGEPGSERG